MISFKCIDILYSDIKERYLMILLNTRNGRQRFVCDTETWDIYDYYLVSHNERDQLYDIRYTANNGMCFNLKKLSESDFSWLGDDEVVEWWYSLKDIPKIIEKLKIDSML